ncbi:hypothetical protein TNCV_1519861 [Trichonephila clavipes]|nr:hypothetical protein TNCV_1519861 [Trichonephila clavipes]
MTRRKWYTHNFLAESQKLLEKAPTSKDVGLTLSEKEISNISKHPRLRLLRRQSSQPGPHRSRRGLRKHNSSYGPRGRSLGRRGQVSMSANLPDHLAHSIALDMLYPMHFALLR